MEDHLDKILYLIIGIAYMIFSKSKNRNTEQPPEADMPEDLLPPAAPATDWIDAGEQAVQEAPATTLYPQATRTKASPTPVHPKPHNTSQKQPQPQIKRLLSQYSGWKKAMIMHELIRPHAYIA